MQQRLKQRILVFDRQCERKEINMSKQVSNKMHILNKVFFILLILDCVGLIGLGITLYSTFKTVAGYGQIMVGVVGVIAAVIAVVQVFEILAKFFLVRSTSPTYSGSSGRKGYIAAAKLLILFNLAAVLINLLSAGGEVATLLSQGRLYLQVVASIAEIIAAFCYLGVMKRI